MTIRKSYEQIRAEVPDYITIVVAAKRRTPKEVMDLIDAGVTDIGENYIQEAEDMHKSLGNIAAKVRWHFIGHLQTNKVNKALGIFDVIQTLDSVKLARAIDKRTQTTVSVLIEVNSGREPQKNGVLPEDVEHVIRDIASMGNISIKGLMTMGPRFGDPEDARPYFQETKKLFEHINALDISNVKMDVLSMGMSNAYHVAVEEGSTLIRPGTILFGERKS